MNSIWDNIDAFTPMFCDIVAYKSGDAETSFEAAVFPLESIEPFADIDPTSSVESIKLIMKKRTVRQSGINPNIGDELRLEDGRKFKVCKIDASMNIYDITARSI